MGNQVTLWQRFRAGVGNIDTLVKVWKWIKLLLLPALIAGGVHQYQLNKRLELVEQMPATKPPPASNPVKKPETTPGDIQKRIDQSVQAQIDRAIREHHEKGH